MKAVWLVRLRVLAGRMRFWAAIVSYNPRDHSLRQGIYLIYVVVFFSIWGFAVLALLANLGSGLLSLVHSLSPSMASIVILAVVLLVYVVIRGYSATKGSPFIFSEADAELICQTPVDRRQVALAWFLGDWLPEGLFFSALAVVLRFASLQMVQQEGVVWAHLPGYLLAGLSIVIIVLPLHMAFMAIDYALGALRLRDDKESIYLRWIPVCVAMVLIILALVARRGLQTLLWPMLYSLEAGFGEANWLAGCTLSLIFAIVGLLALYQASPRLNLSRAAQESRLRWAIHQVSWLGDAHLIDQIKVRQRLGAGHKACRIPGQAKYLVLLWKDWVATLRTSNFGYLMGWIGIFGACLGMTLAPDWGTRIWAFIIWCLLVGQRCTQRLRSDLGIWVITRQLPFSGREMLVVELTTPILGVFLLSWLAIGVSFGLGFSPQISLGLLAPTTIICIGLAAAFDILRHCRSSELLAGQVAELGAGGLVLGFFLAGIPLILVPWIASQMSQLWVNWIVTLFSLTLSLGIIYVLWRLTAAEYHKIK